MKSLCFLQDRHSGSLCFHDLIGCWNSVQRSISHITCEEIDLLRATVFQGHLTCVQKVGLAFTVFVCVCHTAPPFICIPFTPGSLYSTLEENFKRVFFPSRLERMCYKESAPSSSVFSRKLSFFVSFETMIVSSPVSGTRDT